MGASFLYTYKAQNKLAYLNQSPSAATYLTYATWLSNDYCVMKWLLNSLEVKISDSVIFLTTTKEMWDTLKMMYENEMNPSRRSLSSMSVCLNSSREINLYSSFMENSKV